MNKLREIFNTDPESESVKWVRDIVARAWEEEWCCTCKSYIPVDPYLPGFVSDYPECKRGGLALEHCKNYEKGDKNKYGL